jgi:hypothetical protein
MAFNEGVTVTKTKVTINTYGGLSYKQGIFVIAVLFLNLFIASSLLRFH